MLFIGELFDYIIFDGECGFLHRTYVLLVQRKSCLFHVLIFADEGLILSILSVH